MPDASSSTTNQQPAFTASAATLGHHCEYPVLNPILPCIHEFLTPESACALLDHYFTDASNSMYQSASPFVLTFIFRKASMLRTESPRSTSPALLTAMLWVASQTADIEVMHSGKARKEICDKLFAVCTSFLGPLSPDYSSSSSLLSLSSTPPLTLDEVITLHLIGIVISGGEPKINSLKWVHRAIDLARSLKLNQELPITGALSIEEIEERRRVWWWIFAVDRHLALSFNQRPAITDAECHVYQPLDELSWQELDTELSAILCPRYLGPSLKVTGDGYFEYMLPLMTILGDVLDIHQRSYHPRFSTITDFMAIEITEAALREYELSLASFANNKTGKYSTDRQQLVCSYMTYIVHVMYVLLYGPCDPTAMTETPNSWIKSDEYAKCMSHAKSAANAITDILKSDPDMRFMPYLFGIYLLHGSFPFLSAHVAQCVEENMNILHLCETMIHAHEVCLATLDTEYQRNVRNMLRSVQLNERPQVVQAKFLKLLKIYRWTGGGTGLLV
ncbi:fungal-specific transcription factor domain-containing protein [Lipomyces japonicus]|uniref:fungal-specific transcription factor domain-containing protein n=1 Tax=Lipomyces japonicus TaxID=56871 RepID=UPI0034CD63D0